MPTKTEVTMDTRTRMARARTNASEAIERLPGLAGKTRDGAEQMAERLPEAYTQASHGAQGAITRLQKVPDSGLRLLAAASIGFGTGLRLAGAPRLATLAGFAPAPILGFAILSRPHPARTQS
jgi:ABC-type transporter Mla subunit MlaD